MAMASAISATPSPSKTGPTIFRMTHSDVVRRATRARLATQTAERLPQVMWPAAHYQPVEHEMRSSRDHLWSPFSSGPGAVHTVRRRSHLGVVPIREDTGDRTARGTGGSRPARSRAH